MEEDEVMSFFAREVFHEQFFYVLNIKERRKMKTNRTLQIVIIANLTAISTLLYVTLKFPWPFATFLDIQFSNLPAIIGGFALGPVSGVVIVALRTILKLVIVGTSTAYVGEGADVIISTATVLVSSIVYLRLRTRKGAVIASLFGMVTWVFIAVLANYFFLVDFYINFYFGGDPAPLLGFMSRIPNITTDNFMRLYIIYAAIPMNIVLSGLVYGITFLVYKRISHLIDDINEKFFPKELKSPTVNIDENLS